MALGEACGLNEGGTGRRNIVADNVAICCADHLVIPLQAVMNSPVTRCFAEKFIGVVAEKRASFCTKRVKHQPFGGNHGLQQLPQKKFA